MVNYFSQDPIRRPAPSYPSDPLRSPNCPDDVRLPDMPPITDGEDT